MEADVLKKYLPKIPNPDNRRVVIVETGIGLSSFPLIEYVYAHPNVVLYCIDTSKEVIKSLQEGLDPDRKVNFLHMDTEKGLQFVIGAEKYIDLLFFDAVPCAYRTFKEFQMCEHLLTPGSIYVMDNARIPEKEHIKGECKGAACRKGKVIVPYLLASPHWVVKAFPQEAGGMIGAIMQPDAKYSDPAYSSKKHGIPRIKQVAAAVKAYKR